MIYNVIVTRDIKADVYSVPMFVPHIGQAIRSFGDECRRKEPNNVLAAHPEDFELILIGEYDDVSGIFLSWEGCEEHGDTKAWGHKQLAVGSNYKD